MVDPWPVLGIARTTDERRIKKAYAARLKHVHPEDDAEGFQRLREAFEAAIALARWEALHRDAPADGANPPGPPTPEPPPWLNAPWAARVEPTPDALGLADAVTRLAGDPEARTSEDAWGELLASEALWNVDTRSAFEAQLIRRLVAEGLVLPPSAWALLERELHWNAEALALRATLPPGVAELLLERRDEAPVDFASRLCDEGRYLEARAVVRDVVRERSRRAGRAARVLARCDAEEAADALVGAVRELRAAARTWSDVGAWRTLLESRPLRRAETRAAFQRKLLALLAREGQGLGGPAWQLLDDRFRWSREAPAAELALAARALGPAILEAIDGASPAPSDAEVIQRLAPFVAHMDGEAGDAGRRLLEARCRAALERAERLERLEHRRRAIEEAAPVARLAEGAHAASARELVERVGRAAIEHAGRMHAGRRFSAAVDELAPVVGHLPPGMGIEARILLARCHRAAGSSAKAEESLDEVLGADPWNLEALLLMAAVKEEGGQPEGAATVCVRVLQLDPRNREAADRLERLQAERRPAETGGPQTGEGSGGHWWLGWLLLWTAINTFGRGGVRKLLENATVAGVVTFGVVIAVVVVLTLVAVDAHRRGAPALGLAGGDGDSRAQSRGTWALALALFVLVAAALAWLNRDGSSSPPELGHREAFRPPSAAETPRYGRPKNVQILQLGPEELPLRRGRTVSLSARVRYELSSGGGLVKLFAAAMPRGRSVEVDARTVTEPSGTIELSGSFSVPSDATRVDLVASLYAGSATYTQTVATAFLAVEP